MKQPFKFNIREEVIILNHRGIATGWANQIGKIARRECQGIHNRYYLNNMKSPSGDWCNEIGPWNENSLSNITKIKLEMLEELE